MLQVGPPLTEFGQKTPVNPKCTYTTDEKPAAEVAAHAAAALALAAQSIKLYGPDNDQMITPRSMLDAAEAMLQYSTKKAPFNKKYEGNATDVAQKHGVRSPSSLTWAASVGNF